MRVIIWFLVILFGAAMPVFAQNMPYHIDPSAREIVPDLSAVPAIRFLTTADFPPFNYRDAGGELVGFNIDLAKSICGTLSVACTVQAWPWDQAANALADNQGDALLAGLEISPENGKRFDFSSLYLELPGRFVTRNVDIRGFDPIALNGKSVSARKGSAHAQFIQRYLPEVKLVEFDTEIKALEALKSSAVSAYFGDAMRASFWLNDQPDCCSFAGDPYFRPDLFGEGIAAAVPAGHDAVRQAIDYALVKLKNDGTLDELYLRWFPISFY
jgi:polar amino acid transport system substrate-binding protein